MRPEAAYWRLSSKIPIRAGISLGGLNNGAKPCERSLTASGKGALPVYLKVMIEESCQITDVFKVYSSR